MLPCGALIISQGFYILKYSMFSFNKLYINQINLKKEFL